jgi:hypothetical protein
MKMAESMLAQTNKCALFMWQRMLAQLWKSLRGFRANIRGGGQRRRKEEHRRCIAELDKKRLTKMSWMVQAGLLDMCWRRSWFRYISRRRYTGNKEEVLDGSLKVTQIHAFFTTLLMGREESVILNSWKPRRGESLTKRDWFSISQDSIKSFLTQKIEV